MIDRFVALPVGQGDAFFYEREQLNVLVDGGKSTEKLPELIKDHLRIERIDILICTHNDKDHAQGLIGLLNKEEWESSIHEVWLPGSWSYKLKELLEYPDNFFIELAENISQLPERKLPALANLPNLTNPVFEPAALCEEVSNESFIDLCTRDTGFTYKLYSPLLKILQPSSWLFQKSRQHLWLEAIDAASRIREIARLAYSHKLKVRWFDFNEFEIQGQQPNGGEKGILEPVNAREILPITRQITALQYLSLTVDNQQSLVFLGLEQENRPGVLFTADSNINFKIQHKPHSFPMIVTAPHHGAEANGKAYSIISQWHNNSDSIIWVRSDGKFKSRPGSSFITAKGQNFCTICRPSHYTERQVVKLSSQKGLAQWFAEPGVRTCQCQ